MVRAEKLTEADMPKLKVSYEKQEDIPEGFDELYVERNGRYDLTGIEGIKTDADIARVNEALRKERNDHKATKDKLATFGDIDPAIVPATIAELEETKARLEAVTKEGKFDESKMAPVIDAAVRKALGPVEREKTQLQRDLDNARKAQAEKDAENVALKGSITQRTVEQALRDAAIAAKVIPTAIDDAVMYGARVFEVTEDGRVVTKDNAGNAGATPGIEAKDWLKDMQERRPHWWPASQGGGAGGGRGGAGNRASNPWTAENWNITDQGKYVTTHGAEKAAAAAAAVGSKLGATRPPVKAA